MPKINVLKAFRHADIDEVHPREYLPGEQDVSEECAAIALKEKWAEVVSEKKQAPSAGIQTGAEKPVASSVPARRFQGRKSKK